MTNDTIRIEFETTLDEFAHVHVRHIGGAKMYRRERLRALISIGVVWGAVGGAIGVSFVAVLLGRPIGVEVLVGVLGGGLLGGFVGPLCRPQYDRSVNRRVQAMLAELYGPGSELMRCEIELRPGCLWLRQDGVVETAYDWSTLTAVEDTADGVELWFDSLPIVAQNRAFAIPSDRECFVNRARASLPATQHATTTNTRPDTLL
jgi:hypothetical protein